MKLHREVQTPGGITAHITIERWTEAGDRLATYVSIFHDDDIERSMRMDVLLYDTRFEGAMWWREGTVWQRKDMVPWLRGGSMTYDELRHHADLEIGMWIGTYLAER